MKRISFLLALLPVFALADDAAMSWGGTPAMLKGHKTIRMEAEHVVMTIHKDHAAVDCYFVFKNNGPACVVKIGFPDKGWGASTEDYMISKNEHKRPQPYHSFTRFVSWVDGKKVPVTLETASDEDSNNGNASSWHTKIVHFGTNQKRMVRDLYDIPLGEAITSTGSGAMATSEYTLATGSSWKGTIGKAQIDVVFAPDAQTQLKELKSVSEMGAAAEDPRGYQGWDKVPAGTVYYHTRLTPTVDGQKIVFIGHDMKPTPKDDVLVYFYK